MAWHIVMVQQNLRPLNLGAHSLNCSQELRYNNSCLIISSNSSFRRKKYIIKVRKRTKIRKRFNQVPHLTQDTTWESNKNIPCISQTIIAIFYLYQQTWKSTILSASSVVSQPFLKRFIHFKITPYDKQVSS